MFSIKINRRNLNRDHYLSSELISSLIKPPGRISEQVKQRFEKFFPVIRYDDDCGTVNVQIGHLATRYKAHTERMANIGQIMRRSTRIFASGVMVRTSHSQVA